MPLHDTIQTALRTVPGLLGVACYYRRLTSGPSVAAADRTYTEWMSVTAHITGRTTLEEEVDGVWRRREIARTRVSDAVNEWHQGDQFKDNSTTVWAVMGIISSGIGTAAYQIERDIGLRAEGASRKAGV